MCGNVRGRTGIIETQAKPRIAPWNPRKRVLRKNVTSGFELWIKSKMTDTFPQPWRKMNSF